MQADVRAILDFDTRLAEEALQKLVSKPRKVNLTLGNNDASGALGRIRSQLGEFDKSLAASNARVLAFSASAGAMFTVTNSLKEMVKTTIEVERKMTSINSILQASSGQFKQFGNSLFKIARDTSSSFSDVADAAEELARQGVGIEETLKRTSSAMKLAKVSGVEVATAVEAITSALNSNNDALLDSEQLINKLVAVDAKFAVSAGGLAEAIKRVGSVASDAGMGIDDLIAAITSAQQTTARGEAVIGNALKTIFTRAQRPKVLEDFESLGIATKDAVGNIRPLSNILVEVAKRYDDLSSSQQQSVSELVGGVYQINILKALFRDLGKETSFFGQALRTSQGASNEAEARISELNQTLDALFKRFTANVTQVGSGVGQNVFAPLFKNLLKGANSGLEQINREMQGESGAFIGKFIEASFKGLGNILSGPVLIGGITILVRFMGLMVRQSKDAIATLAGLNSSLHSLELVTANVNSFLEKNPQYLLAMARAGNDAAASMRVLAAATAAYSKEAVIAADVSSIQRGMSSSMAQAAVAQAGLFVAPVRGAETLQRKKAAVGLIPQVQEMAGAYAGGYKPGQVKDMNVPGMGRVYYNTAEKVKWFPGMGQPAIMPPQGSRAGRNYEQNFAQTHGFNPYMAGGMIPNFAANPELQRAFTERFYRAKKGGRYGGGRFVSKGEKLEEFSSADDYYSFTASKYPTKIYRDKFGNSFGVKRGFTGLSSIPSTSTTVSGSISAIINRAPDDVTRRQLLRLAREFDYPVEDLITEKRSKLSILLHNKEWELRMRKALSPNGDISPEKYALLDYKNSGRQRENVEKYLRIRKSGQSRVGGRRLEKRASDYLFRGVSLDEITNLRRLGQVTSLGTSNADDKLGTFVTSSFGKAAGFGAATLKESGQGYVLALDKKRLMGRSTAESIFGSEEKNTIKAGRIEKDDVLGVVDLKTRQLRSLEEFAARNEKVKNRIGGARNIPIPELRKTISDFRNSSFKPAYVSTSDFIRRMLFDKGQDERFFQEIFRKDYGDYGINLKTGPAFQQKRNLQRLKKILSHSDSEILSAGRYSMARGLVPNFSPLSAAISRESATVNPGLIRVGSHSALRGPGNPDGIGVYNLRDEPMGLGQGVQRAMGMGLNPKTHGIPNYAKWDWAKEKIGKPYFGDETSPAPGNSFAAAALLSLGSPIVGAGLGGGETGKIAEEAVDAFSLYYTLSTFLRGPKGKGAAIAITGLSAMAGVFKQSTTSFNNLDAEVNELKDKIQKTSSGLNTYSQTLEHLQDAYTNNSVGTDKIVKLQERLATSLSEFPAELRQQLLSAKGLNAFQDIAGKYTEMQTKKMQEKELALGISTSLNEQPFYRRGSLLGFQEEGTKAGEEKLKGVALSLLNVVGSEGLKKIGGGAGLGGGNLLSKLGTAGLSASTLKEIGRINPGQLKMIQSVMAAEQVSRESHLAEFQRLEPKRRADLESYGALQKQSSGLKEVIKQTFAEIGQTANLRMGLVGRRGLMGAAGFNEQIQGLAGLMSETGSPQQMAMVNYKAQIAANQMRAAEGISGVFSGLRTGIMGNYNQFDLTRMGEIPGKFRSGQGQLIDILGRNSVSGIGEGAISLFKSLGKDNDVADIKKLMADSNEKLVEIYQTLEEQNKLAEIQKNIALQRAEFERTLKVGGGFGSFMDRSVKLQQVSDIYTGKFGLQSGIFRGQGATDLLKSYLNLGGQSGSAGFGKLLGIATDERAKDIVSSQKMFNKALEGTGLSFGIPTMAEARGIAETQIAAELKTGDSAMEKQMAGLQAALQGAINSTMGGQLNNAAQVFANVLAGSSTFSELNRALNQTQEVLRGVDNTIKSMQTGAGGLIRAGGNIPISAAATEKMMAKAGGYNPGYIRRAGNLIYNSAERVDYLPGVREPVISPPPGSLAGFLHRQNLNAAFGFAANGYTASQQNKLNIIAEQLEKAQVSGDRAKAARIEQLYRQYQRVYYYRNIPKGFESGVGEPMNWNFNIRPQAAYPTASIGGSTFSQYAGKSGEEMSSLNKEKILTRYYRDERGRFAKSVSLAPREVRLPFQEGLGKPVDWKFNIRPQAIQPLPGPMSGRPNLGDIGNLPSFQEKLLEARERARFNPKDFAIRSTGITPQMAAKADTIGAAQLRREILRANFRNASTFGQTVSSVGALIKGGGVPIGQTLGNVAVGLGAYDLAKGIFGGYGQGAKAGNYGQVAMETYGQAMGAAGLAAKFGGAGLVGTVGSGALAYGSAALPLGALGYTAYKGVEAVQAQRQEQEAYRNAGLSPETVRKMKESGQLEWGIAGDPRLTKEDRRNSLAGTNRAIRRVGNIFKNAINASDIYERGFFGSNSGDPDYLAKKNAYWKQRELENQPRPITSVPLMQDGRFTSRAGYLEEMYGSEEKGTRGVIGALTHGKDLRGQIGAMNAGLRVLTPNKENDATRAQLQADIRNKSVEYNAGIIAKMFNINNPEQLKRLQLGVRGAMESGNLQGYVKSLGNPSAAPVSAQTKPDGQKIPIAGQSKLDINLNLGGNVKTEGNQEEKDAIQAAINSIREQLTKEITAIADSLGATARVALANVRNPNTPNQYE